MGTCDVLLLIRSKYRFLVKLKARALLKKIEKRSVGHVECGYTTDNPRRIDWKLVRKYVRLTEKIKNDVMQRLKRRLDYIIGCPIFPIDWMRLDWCVSKLQTEVPAFQHRVYVYFPIFYDNNKNINKLRRDFFRRYEFKMIENLQEINMWRHPDAVDRRWMPSWMINAKLHY